MCASSAYFLGVENRIMMSSSCAYTFPKQFSTLIQKPISGVRLDGLLQIGFLKYHAPRKKAVKFQVSAEKVNSMPPVQLTRGQSERSLTRSSTGEKKVLQGRGKKEHHLWKKRDSAGSGQKALNLIRIISGLPDEKSIVYAALDKWVAWETEFPVIAAAKALRILRKRSQWRRLIQVAKWMLSKGQGATMGTYDLLLLAFDMDQRVDEAEMLWNMILNTNTRSISKWLFSRIISLYDHHNKPDKIIEVFADMEELAVKPDEDTLRRIARAFHTLGQLDKQKMVLKRYGRKWKYIHFKGERVRVKTDTWDEESSRDT